MKRIRVTWIDSHTNGDSWIPRSAGKRFAKCAPCVITTAGFLFHENRRFVTVSQNRSSGMCSSLIKIPKCSILKRKGK